ncbi:MAG TPA: hypothetical protein VIY68_09480 [Steroidobacteraceae bacterium]|jgi:hypothetical protein
MTNENLALQPKVKDFNTWQTSYSGNAENRSSAGMVAEDLIHLGSL